jgi:GcrA cell cycle regulator
MSWTDERVATLKKLWLEGLSASQIMRQLGGVSRSAVIGKVHRLGLTRENAPKPPRAPRSGLRGLQPGPVGDAASPPRRYTAPTAPQPKSIAAKPPTPKPVAVETTALVAPEPVAAAPKRVFAAGERSVTILQIGPRCCQWPVGPQPAPGNMDRQLFCGEIRRGASSAYCAEHAGFAYQKPSTAAQKRAAQAYSVDTADKMRAALKTAARR